VGDAERLARATLTYAAEPYDRTMGDLIARVGPLAVVETVRRSDTFPRWRARLDAADPAADLVAFVRGGGRVLCPGDPEWPTQLDDLGRGRPYALWLRGQADLRTVCLRSVSVVGSREASAYGRHVAAEMAAELAERGWCAVSGGAVGIDSAAHRAALAVGGTTVVVFAGGLDRPYPKKHEGLFGVVARRGVLVSEVPPHVHPVGPRFLIRNRVIAALTRGTVVVEAAIRSGALSTAQHARRLHRAVMAVPGPVTSATSGGCHMILREWADAAICVTSAAEVIEHVGAIGADLAPEPVHVPRARDGLGGETRAVLEALPAGEEMDTDTLAATAGVPVEVAMACLGELAALGFAERNRGGWRLRR
jgi:DNA processing protein